MSRRVSIVGLAFLVTVGWTAISLAQITPTPTITIARLRSLVTIPIPEWYFHNEPREDGARPDLPFTSWPKTKTGSPCQSEWLGWRV